MRLDLIKAFVNVRSQMNVVGVIENTTHLAVVTAFSETRELVEPDEFSFDTDYATTGESLAEHRGINGV